MVSNWTQWEDATAPKTTTQKTDYSLKVHMCTRRCILWLIIQKNVTLLFPMIIVCWRTKEGDLQAESQLWIKGEVALCWGASPQNIHPIIGKVDYVDILKKQLKTSVSNLKLWWGWVFEMDHETKYTVPPNSWENSWRTTTGGIWMTVTNLWLQSRGEYEETLKKVILKNPKKNTSFLTVTFYKYNKWFRWPRRPDIASWEEKNLCSFTYENSSGILKDLKWKVLPQL